MNEIIATLIAFTVASALVALWMMLFTLMDIKDELKELNKK